MSDWCNLLSSFLVVLSTLFFALLELAPQKKLAEMEARSNIDILNLSTYNSDVQSIYPLCFLLGGVNGFSEK